MKKILLALGFFSSLSTALAVPSYTAEIVDDPHAITTDFYAVDSSGVTVGEMVKLDGHYVITRANGKTTVISPVGDEEDSFVVGGISGFGEVVGSRLVTDTGDMRAVKLNKGSIQDISGLANFTFSEANAQSENGIIVGSLSKTSANGTEAYILDGATPRILKGLGGVETKAFSVNSSRIVVGSASLLDGKTHAALWDASGKVVDLGSLDFQNSRANDINATGQVVGILWNGSNEGAEEQSGKGFLYSEGKLVKLPTLGGSYSEARAINDKGEIVGVSTVDTERTHAFLFTGGKMIDLNTLVQGQGIELIEARDINNRGIIVGSGLKGKKTVGIILRPN
ncbi:hypothetical protein JNK13_00500 [bacterium]|nr:hypothetical protein [bacterium]